MRASRVLAAGILAAGTLMLSPGIVLAEPPGRLPQPITDTAGALGNQEDEVSSALANLEAEQNLQLWLAYVDDFDGMSGQDWTNQTATLSGLGGNDLLFAVATGDRAYGFSLPDSLPVSDAELERILATSVEPRLRAGDWAGAGIALADSLAEPQTSSGTSSRTSSGSSGGGGSGLLVVLLLLAVAVGAVVLFLAARRKRGTAPGAPGAGAQPGLVPLPDLRQQAAAALIDVDDEIRTSEQELGFAIAQFGEEQAQPFRVALEQSRADLAAAFAAQARLDSGQLDEATARAALGEILDRTKAADERLDAQVALFDKLREMDRNLDTILAGLQTRVGQLRAAADQAGQTLNSLAQSYPAAALAVVGDNLTQAGTRIDFAESSTATGLQLLGAGDRAGGVAHARAAEDALGQAQILLETVQRAPDELAEAGAAIQALVAETGKDIAEAQRLGAAELSPHVEHARKTLSWAEQVMAAGNYDPIAVRRAVADADNALEQALGPVRDAAAATQRARELLASTTSAAHASVAAAQDFITTRRGAVGAAARTDLAEAQRALAEGQAAVSVDPQAALAAMTRADQLADRALAQAQRDEQAYQSRGAPTGRSGGMDMGSIVLGGILIDSMTRGRGGAGAPRSSPRNAPPPRRPGPGSFGGAATRGRRGGGGRF